MRTTFELRKWLTLIAEYILSRREWLSTFRQAVHGFCGDRKNKDVLVLVVDEVPVSTL